MSDFDNAERSPKRPSWHSRDSLRDLVENVETSRGRRFALFIQAMIFLSIIVFTVQTLPGLPSWLDAVLVSTESVLVVVFTVEYLVRAYVARPTTSYVFSGYGIIDIMSVAPFYLGLAGFQTLRVLRVFRLLRILKLTRYSRAMQRLVKAIAIAREELTLFAVIALLVVYFSAVGIYVFERHAQPENFSSVPHSLWWAVVTLTTVGYGDCYPVTAGGRVFTGVVLITALGIVSIPSGIIAASLTEVRQEEEASRDTADETDDVEA